MDQALAAMHQGNPRRLPISLELGSQGENVSLFCRFPEEMAPIVEGQLYAQYPECALERIDEPALALPDDWQHWSATLHVDPDLFPLKRYPQFEDALNRTLSDPLTGLLTTLAATKRTALDARVRLTIRPASGRRRKRATQCLRRLARPFFRSHPRLAHLYVWAALHRHFFVRFLARILGLCPRTAAHNHVAALADR